jgi:hypothetical protein
MGRCYPHCRRGVSAGPRGNPDASRCRFIWQMHPDSAQVLYWSARGEVACATHAPQPGSENWSEQRWTEVPEEVRRGRATRYQCQHCADSRTPIVHRRLNTHIHLEPA